MIESSYGQIYGCYGLKDGAYWMCNGSNSAIDGFYWFTVGR